MSVAPVRPGTVTAGHASRPVARTLGALPVVLALIGLIAGVVSAQQTYAQVRDGSGAAAFDKPVQDWMVAHRQPWLDTAGTWFTNLGGKTGMTVLATLTVLGAMLVASWAVRVEVLGKVSVGSASIISLASFVLVGPLGSDLINAASMLLEFGQKPVSYTHLDVYKRQINCLIGDALA